jgi:hypothetical protein
MHPVASIITIFYGGADIVAIDCAPKKSEIKKDCWKYRPRNNVYCCSILLFVTAATCFGLYLTIFRRNIQFFWEIITLTTEPLFYILFFVIVVGLTVCFYMAKSCRCELCRTCVMDAT